MYEVHCLFNFDEVNYRLTIHTDSQYRILTYDDLKRGLSIHPKLKDINFFDEQKYVLEIFDKTFQEYIKLSKDTSIPDYTKLRSRRRPKSRLPLRDGGEDSRRHTVYTEKAKEDEQGSKALKETSMINEKQTAQKALLVHKTSIRENVNDDQWESSNPRDFDENRYSRHSAKPNRSSPPHKVFITTSESQNKPSIKKSLSQIQSVEYISDHLESNRDLRPFDEKILRLKKELDQADKSEEEIKAISSSPEPSEISSSHTTIDISDTI